MCFFSPAESAELDVSPPPRLLCLLTGLCSPPLLLCLLIGLCTVVAAALFTSLKRLLKRNQTAGMYERGSGEICHVTMNLLNIESINKSLRQDCVSFGDWREHNSLFVSFDSV